MDLGVGGWGLVFTSIMTNGCRIQVRFDIANFIKNWKMYTGVKTKPIEGNIKNSVEHDKVIYDNLRCNMFSALLSLENEFQVNRKLCYTVSPTSVYAGCEYERLELKLAPLTFVNNIRDKGPIKVSCKGIEDGLFLSPPPRPQKASDVDKDKYMYTPFWWVDMTPLDHVANMKYVSRKVNGCTVLYLTNSRKLVKHERLFVFKAPKVKVELEGGEKEPSEPSESSESEADPDAQRHKKQPPSKKRSTPFDQKGRADAQEAEEPEEKGS